MAVIEVIATLGQKNGASFPLVLDKDVKGGFHVVTSVVERDAIDASCRSIGMFVFTSGTNQLWRLASEPNVWVEWVSGGSGTSLVDTMVAGEPISSGDPVSLDVITGKVVQANASIPSRKEVYGLAKSDAILNASVDVTLSGVHTYTGLTPLPALGTVIFLSETGGWSDGHPDANGPSDVRITRIGQVRSPISILVGIQVILDT